VLVHAPEVIGKTFLPLVAFISHVTAHALDELLKRLRVGQKLLHQLRIALPHLLKKLGKHLRILSESLAKIGHTGLSAHLVVTAIVLVIAAVAKGIRDRLRWPRLLRGLGC
jgi:hypothetical protein